MNYRIRNSISGADLGVYGGATPAEALDNLAKDAGYADQTEASAAAAIDPSELTTVPMAAATAAVASNARPTDTGVDGAVDVDVELELDDGTVLSGEVTLVRNQQGDWSRYGRCPDHWIEGALLTMMRDRLDEDQFRHACSLLSAEAGAEVGRAKL